MSFLEFLKLCLKSITIGEILVAGSLGFLIVLKRIGWLNISWLLLFLIWFSIFIAYLFFVYLKNTVEIIPDKPKKNKPCNKK